jgi:hypothetical protein
VPVVALIDYEAAVVEAKQRDAGKRFFLPARAADRPPLDDRTVSGDDRLAEAALDRVLVGERPVGVGLRLLRVAEGRGTKDCALGVERGDAGRVVLAPALRPLLGPAAGSLLRVQVASTSVETKVS